MMHNIPIVATAHVTLTKHDSNGNVIGVEEHDVELSEEEAKALWHSQQKE